MSSSWFGQYLSSLVRTPRVFMDRCGDKRVLLGSGEMKKTLSAFDVLFFGIGCILGSGIFVTTGRVAALVAGPGVSISYTIAALGALLSALCYAEFAVELKVAGSGFSYVMYVCGEFMGWIVGICLCFVYVLSSAAVARAFSSYFATLCQQEPEFFWIPAGGLNLDPLAAGMCLLLSVLLAVTTKGTSLFNNAVSISNVLVILFIIVLGFMNADINNWSPFLPFGAKGMMDGAGLVYFSFIGFDAVATTAEEVKNPASALPIGIVGSVIVVTLVYFLMCCVITLMVPYYDINIYSPFPMAFSEAGMGWAATIVSLGAALGITTTLLVNLMAQARIFAVIARENMLPSFLSKIHPKTGTPLAATAFLGVFTSALAFCTEFDILADMVSIATLFAFYIVCAALLYHRYYAAEVNTKQPILISLAGLTLINVAFAVCWQMTENFLSFLIFIAYCVATGAMHYMVPQVRFPTQFGVPFGPWVPSLAMFMNVFIMSGMDPMSFLRTGGFLLATVVLYLVYSLHSSAIAAANAPPSADVDDEDDDVIKGESRDGVSFLHGSEVPLERRVSSYRLVNPTGSATQLSTTAGKDKGSTEVTV